MADDELIGSLHEIGAFSLEELAGIADELYVVCAVLEFEGSLLEEDSSVLDEICSLEENASLDDKFSLARLFEDVFSLTRLLDDEF